ncbi:hypothetical protein EPUL_005796, partial [Erysiphe pulchra]
NKSNLTNLSATSANSNSLFGAPQGPSLQGANFKQNLFGSELASSTCIITQSSPKKPFSASDVFLKDNMQSGELKKSVFTSSDKPTSATNLFCHQTSSKNLFSHCIENQEFSNVFSKLSSPKAVYDTNQQQSIEIEMEISENSEVQNFGLSQDISSTFSPSQSVANAINESESLGSMVKTITSQDSLHKPTSSVQLQMPRENSISQLPMQSTTGSQDSVILNKLQTEKNDLANESGLFKVLTNQRVIKATGNEKHHVSIVQPLSSEPVVNLEEKLSSNIFGQANLSVSSSHPSITFLMVKKFFWDQTPDETKSFSSKPSNESSLRSTQTSFLPQNPKDTTSSEVCRMSGNENTTVSTTEMESSKASSRIGNSQEIRRRNKYVPKILPRNPLFKTLALTSQIKDEEIIASLPAKCNDDIEREQFFALYRLRALNQAMGKLFLDLTITSDPQIALDFYREERHNILSKCTSLGRKPKRKLSYGESDNYLNKKKRT